MRKRALGVKNYVYLAVAVGLVISFFVIHRPLRLVRCALVEYNRAYRAVAEQVYVPKTMSEEGVEEVLAHVATAKARNEGLYGRIEGNPTVIITTESEESEKFYGNDAGVAHYSVFGNFVVIGKKGINADIISHEMAHSELAARIGWHEANSITPWFNEGLATQVDHRFIYSDQVWDMTTDFGKQVPDICQTEAFKSFYCEDTEQRLDNYVLARHEVKEWLDFVGQDGLNELIESVRDGEDLKACYKSIYAASPYHSIAEHE